MLHHLATSFRYEVLYSCEVQKSCFLCPFFMFSEPTVATVLEPSPVNQSQNDNALQVSYCTTYMIVDTCEAFIIQNCTQQLSKLAADP